MRVDLYFTGLELNNFLKLSLAAMLFYGIYGIMLLIQKEKLTAETVGLLSARIKRRKD